jgi:hypothetical protein
VRALVDAAMNLAEAHKEYVKRMLDVAKGGMKALVCDPVTVRAIDASTTLR